MRSRLTIASDSSGEKYNMLHVYMYVVVRNSRSEIILTVQTMCVISFEIDGECTIEKDEIEVDNCTSDGSVNDIELAGPKHYREIFQNHIHITIQSQTHH